MNCYICSHNGLNIYFKIDKWNILKCRKCGHAVVDPVPQEKEVIDSYGKKYFDTHYDYFKSNSSEFKKRVRDNYGKLKKFVLKEKSSGELLDVGCGRGYFLQAGSKHFKSTGFDISAENFAFINDELKIDLKVDNWDNVYFEKEKFDVITFWHSLEHFLDPRLYLSKSINWLKSDGIIVIDVPMHDCIDVCYMKENWPNWDIPFHLHHFTKESLRLLARQLNLSIIKEDTFHSEVVKEVLAKKKLFRIISRSIAKCFDGGHFAIVCKK